MTISLILLAIITTCISVTQSKDALIQNSYAELTALRDIKKFQIEQFLQERISDIKAFSQSEDIQNLTHDLMDVKNSLDLKSSDPFPIENTNVQKKTSPYELFLHNYMNEYGYLDIYIISLDGQVMYSASKRSDYGTNLINGPLKESCLAHVWKKSLEDSTPTFSDMKAYAPRNNEPTMFLATPVKFKNEAKAVVVIQISDVSINTIMNFREGYGATQEDYLVGPDHLMRSDSFLDPESHSLKASFSHQQKGSVDTEATREAFTGKTDTKIIIDYNGNSVLSSYSSINISDTFTWAILSEIDEAEVMIVPNNIRDSLIISVIIVVAIIIIMATLLISFSLIKPLHAFKNKILQITNHHDLTLRVNTDVPQEIQEIGNSFNSLLKSLQLLDESNADKDKQLIHQLYTDELTNLPNRNALSRDMDMYKDAHIAICNIRSFKHINDVFGFEAGNFVLKELSRDFVSVVLEKGLTAYRVGGDELVILNNNAMSASEFEAFILDLFKQIEGVTYHYAKAEADISVSPYVGICIEKEKRLEKADMALSEAKKHHIDCVVYSDKNNVNPIQKNNLHITSKIKHALSHEGILVYYQPIVDRDENANKYEALVRMKDKEEVLSPYFFLEIAKKTKYYSQISHKVISTAFETFRDRSESFSVNLTAEDILNQEVVTFIKAQLRAFPHPNRVIFEIVESEDIYNIDEIKAFIIEIKEMGAKIAIDDFGTGYSNFSYMMKIKPNYLKIDGSLIKHINEDNSAYTIVKTIVSFAKELDIKTIAEFVHSKEVFEVCKELGVDEFQGYYFSEPRSSDHLLH